MATDPHPQSSTHEHHGHHAHLERHDPAAMVELLDLDAEVLHDYLTELSGWLRDLTADRPPARILDLGAGTGAGTFALLDRFEGSEVTAVDLSEPSLARIEEKATERGLTDRVRTLQADLDTARLSALDTGPMDLAWASASLHHLTDPDRVMREVLVALRPGALFVVAELDSFPRFLPDDAGVGEPGLERRLHAAMAELRRAELPEMGSDWGARLGAAGFAVEAARTFAIELTAPLSPATSRYAQLSLRRMASALTTNADDRAALDTLVDGDSPSSILRRTDLTVRAERSVWVARRP